MNEIKTMADIPAELGFGQVIRIIATDGDPLPAADHPSVLKQGEEVNGLCSVTPCTVIYKSGTDNHIGVCIREDGHTGHHYEYAKDDEDGTERVSAAWTNDPDHDVRYDGAVRHGLIPDVAGRFGPPQPNTDLF